MTQYGIDKYGADCRAIRPHLKDIDKLFDIAFNYDNECYIIYFNGGVFQVLPWKFIDANTIEKIRKVYWENVNGDPFAEVDANNERIEKSNDRQREDIVYELAKDMRKAILKEF